MYFLCKKSYLLQKILFRYTVTIFFQTLSMAIWRYVALRGSTRSATHCTFKRCYQVIAAAYICPLFFCILNYLYFEIVGQAEYIVGSNENKLLLDPERYRIWEFACNHISQNSDCSARNVTLYRVEVSSLAQKYEILHTIHFWTFSVIIKLIPCFLLTFFMCWLVNVSFKL